jgi:hypothetical protein
MKKKKRLTGLFYSRVVVGVDADFVPLEIERVLANVKRAEFVVTLQIGPTPQTAVNDVRKAFPVRNLQTTVQRSAITTKVQHHNLSLSILLLAPQQKDWPASYWHSSEDYLHISRRKQTEVECADAQIVPYTMEMIYASEL